MRRLKLHQIGSALIGALIVLTISMLLASLIYTDALHTIELHGSEIHFAKAHARATYRALDVLMHSPPAEPVHLNCVLGAAQTEGTELSSTVCSSYNLADSSVLALSRINGSLFADSDKFPQFDFNRIFNLSSPCETTYLESTAHTRLGFALTPTALVSSKLCSTPPGREGHAYIVDGNFEAEADVTIESTPDREPYLLAARGYLDIGVTLIMENDVLIVAGGDLHISRVKVLGASPRQITLVSATGIVAVDSIEGPAALKISAWEGVVAPAVPEVLNTVIPPLLESEVLGLGGH